MKIPVFSGPRCIELADASRVARLRHAPNVELVIRRKDKQVVQINLLEAGDDSMVRSRRGNPQAFTFLETSEAMPGGIWQFKGVQLSA